MAQNFLFDGLFGTAEHRENQLLILPDGNNWSYGRVLDASAQYANLLVSMGVKPADRVAVQVDKSPESIVLYLATVRAGGVFLPLNTAYTQSEISYFIEDATPALFVCDPARKDEMEALVEGSNTRLLCLDGDGFGSFSDAAATFGCEFNNIAREENDLAAILYTSGTTGLSKGAMLSHDNLLSNAQTLAAYWAFTDADTLLHALPIFHTHGLFVGTNVILLQRAKMIFLARFNVDQLIQFLPQATCLMGVPTFYTRLLTKPEFNQDLVSHIRLFVSGSAPLLSETHLEFEARTGHRILERYGMTETNMNTSNPYDGERRAGTVGFPLPGVELQIMDENTAKPVKAGEIGMIEVRGPNIFQGYWNKPEKTAEELRENGYFITGDLGRLDEQGYLQIVGREKDLIISGGFNVYPKQIEVEIDALDGVVESAVFGIAHADFGEAVAAAVVCESGVLMTESELVEKLGNDLARFKLPKKVVFLDELPRNTMGKVQKNVLRQNYG